MNKLLSVALLVTSAVLVAVRGYNFDDADFNELLADDLDNLYESLDAPTLHVRNRRDEEAVNTDKCRGRKKKLCCGDNVIDELHDKDTDLKRECFKEVLGREPKDPKNKDMRHHDPFRCDKVDKHRKEITCVMQCVGQKKNILDKEGNPMETELTAMLKEAFAKESWIGSSLQDKVIPTCLEEARNATTGRDASDTCNPAGIKLKHCLFREVQLSCPADQIKDQKSCDRLKERIKSKTAELFPPQPPQGFMNDE